MKPDNRYSEILQQYHGPDGEVPSVRAFLREQRLPRRRGRL